MEREKKEKKKICYECREIIRGIPGIDFQYVKTKRGDRYYCAKCVALIQRGK